MVNLVRKKAKSHKTRKDNRKKQEMKKEGKVESGGQVS